MKPGLASILFLPFAAAGAADTNGLPALAPAFPEMPPTFWEQHGTAILVGVPIFVALAMAVLWQIFKTKPQPILPPATVARQALEKLRKLPEDGRSLSEISQVLRRYVIAAFGFPPGEPTTAEFSAAIAASEKIGGELARTISGFLRECDERKFSPANASVPLNAASRALDLVERIENRRVEIRPQIQSSK